MYEAIAYSCLLILFPLIPVYFILKKEDRMSTRIKKAKQEFTKPE